MKNTIALFAIVCGLLFWLPTNPAHGQKAKWPPLTEWYSVQHRGWPYTWSWSDLSTPTVEFAYPMYYVELGRNRDVWVNQLMTRKVQGDIRGKTVRISAMLVIRSPGRWYFNGFLNPSDYGTAPVRARLFLLGYDQLYAQVSAFTPNLPDLSQWSVDSVLLPEVPGEYLLDFAVPITSDRWSNVNGQRSQSGLDVCAGNVKQVGLCFAGGRYYTVGVGQQAPEATITITSFSIQ